MNLTLWGAYHRLREPLDQRKLAVHLILDRAPELPAVVEAEHLAEKAATKVELRRRTAVIEYRMFFTSDGGAPCSLELEQRLVGFRWTELSGIVRNGGPDVWARATLRLDYRDFELQQLVAIARAALRIIS